MSKSELEDFCISLNESKFRANQLRKWIFEKFALSFDEMTDLSKNFREKLKKNAEIIQTKIKQKQISIDSTVKYLLEFEDGNLVETVLMRFDNRENLTACVSSQIGCKMGCAFCATAKRGFVRNLSAYEIAQQVLVIQQDLKVKVTNVVFMGQGEPLLNLENILKAISIFNEDFKIGKRRITVSTCGVVPGIENLAKLDFQCTLAVSLHAVSNDLRNKLMPINKKYPIEVLIDSLQNFVQKTSKRVTIEYVLLGGVNDSVEDAKNLFLLIKNLKCNINLIPYNPCENDQFSRPKSIDIQKFKYILEQSSKKVTLRLERGKDIDAACGQLSGKFNKKISPC